LFEITNSDIAKAIVDCREKGYENKSCVNIIVPSSNNMECIARLIGNKVGVPVCGTYNIDGNKRAVIIGKSSGYTVNFGCNDIRLLPIIADVYRSIGVIASWNNRISFGSKLMITIDLPYRNMNRKLLEKTAELLYYIFHFKVNKKNSDLTCCVEGCDYDNGNNNMWFYPNMCNNHVLRLSNTSLYNLVYGSKVSEFNFLNHYSSNEDVMLALCKLRRFKNNVTENKKCVICGDSAYHAGLVTDCLCSKHFMEIDWSKFEEYYVNKLVEWDELKDRFNEFKLGF
jgi:hypothetical protein